MLNVDMEDPPDQIPLLLDALEAGGCDIVLGVREQRQSPLLRSHHLARLQLGPQQGHGLRHAAQRRPRCA